MNKTGILLINLGTPDSPSPKDVKSYLSEFLMDSRVIDLPWLWRQWLVKGIIIPKRYKQSAASYAKIWTKEGSPLLFHMLQLKTKLQEAMGSTYLLEIAMRYKNPSIQHGLEKLLSQSLSELIIVPLFPQYASATTGSVKQKVMEILKNYLVIPKVTFINNFFNHADYIEAVAELGKTCEIEDYDHILFSYHGLPKRQIQKSTRNNHCLSKSECCHQITSQNLHCYSAQCFATTQAIAAKLNLTPNNYSICFQSRLGKEPWLEPYASETIRNLSKNGIKNLLVFSPSFVCDCLETTYEIGHEYALEFMQTGGKRLTLVPGLNTHPSWIRALKKIILEKN